MVQQLQMLLFWVVAVLSVLAAMGVALNRNAVHSALFLLLNFCMLAVMYVMLNAQFVAMVQVAIYAGAIVVLFLFVEMLLGGDGQSGEPRWFTPRGILVVLAGFVFLTVVGTVVFEVGIGGAHGTDTAEKMAQIGQTQAIGLALFTDYLLVFELTGVLMLVGMIGAIVLGKDWRRRSGKGPWPCLTGQESEDKEE